MTAWLASSFSIIWLTLTGVVATLSLVRFRRRTTVLILLLGIGSLVGLYRVTSIPLPRDVAIPQGSVVLDRDGRVIGSYSDLRRIIIGVDELPSYVLDAVVAAEDRGFYNHGGVSLTSLVRASLANLRSLNVVQGGSTITQQYVKNAILHDPSRSWIRKTREAVLAVKLEDRYSKSQILNFYLNTIYFGRGVYGIEAASRVYFAKSARHLSLAEAAFLAGIIRSPEFLQPDEDPNRARERRDSVLEAMAKEGFIGKETAARAIRAPLGVEKEINARIQRVKAGYFIRWARSAALEAHFGDCLDACGLRIHTTLDLDIQHAAEDAVSKVLTRRTDPEAALVAMTPQGEVLAFVAGRSLEHPDGTGFDLASDYPGRHGGSALKPFTLLAALEAGMPPTATLDGSSPRTIKEPECTSKDEPWQVRNYGNSSYGLVSLASATALSVNTAYAEVAGRLGPAAIAEVLTRFGFDRKGTTSERVIQPLCSLALGALDVTPLEMTRAYAGLAGQGRLPHATPVRYVENQAGHCLAAFVSTLPFDCDENLWSKDRFVTDPEVVASTTEILRGVVQFGTGSGIELPVPVAGKTGTSQNNTDAWFAGYSEDLAATVWTGYPLSEGGTVPQMRACRNRKRCKPFRGADVSGGTLPARIWTDFMRHALEELPTSPEQEASGGGFEPDAEPGEVQPAARSVTKRSTVGPNKPYEEQPRPKTSPPPDPPDEDPLPLPLPVPIPTPEAAPGAIEEPFCRSPPQFKTTLFGPLSPRLTSQPPVFLYHP